MVTAQLATIPDRVNLLAQTIHSLLPQADRLNVMLNGGTYTPPIKNRKLFYWHFDNSKGDGVKFYNLPKGYIFTCDDDLLYPEDYVETMINKLRQYDNEVILTNHGRIMNEKPVKTS